MMLEPQLLDVPSPIPTPLSETYWDGTAAEELRYQRCTQCSAANFGPSVACSSCRSLDLEWQVSGGHGVLYAWTVVWRAPTAAFATPYAPIIVRLSEGYDMVSALVGVDHAAIRADMSLQVEFHRLAAGVYLPFFGPT